MAWKRTRLKGQPGERMVCWETEPPEGHPLYKTGDVLIWTHYPSLMTVEQLRACVVFLDNQAAQLLKAAA